MFTLDLQMSVNSTFIDALQTLYNSMENWYLRLFTRHLQNFGKSGL